MQKFSLISKPPIICLYDSSGTLFKRIKQVKFNDIQIDKLDSVMDLTRVYDEWNPMALQYYENGDENFKIIVSRGDDEWYFLGNYTKVNNTYSSESYMCDQFDELISLIETLI